MVRFREKVINWADSFRPATAQHRGHVQRELKAHAKVRGAKPALTQLIQRAIKAS